MITNNLTVKINIQIMYISSTFYLIYFVMAKEICKPDFSLYFGEIPQDVYIFFSASAHNQ